MKINGNFIAIPQQVLLLLSFSLVPTITLYSGVEMTKIGVQLNSWR